MHRSHLIAYLVMATAAGFLGGVLFERGRRPDTAPRGAEAAPLVNTGTVPPPAAKDGPQARAEAAIAAKKWAEAVVEIRAVIASGKANWDEALALVLRALAVEDVVEYALREEALEPLAGEIAFHRHSVPLARALGTFEAELYLEQAIAWLGEAHEGAFLAEMLEGADEEELPRILRALEGNVSKEMLPALVRVAREAKRADLQLQALKTIASLGPACEPALRDLAGAEEKILAEAAAVALQMVKPPVSGFLVLQPAGREDRPGAIGKRPFANPLRRGDIVTQVGDMKIESEAAWKQAQGKLAGRASVDLTVVRKGEAMVVAYPVQLGPPKGRFVTAVK